ncbi:MAG: WG repeat-containing protein [Clostridia bacterium]|nr:WG repeat-containing protein [Clostridia bacterium]
MKKIIAMIIITLMFINTAVSAEITVDFANENVYKYARTFKKGLSIVTTDIGYGVINNYGNYVLENIETAVGIASNGLIAVLGENGYTGFFNGKGEQVTDYIYDSFIDVHEKNHTTNVGYISNLHNGGDGTSDLIPVSYQGKFGFINYQGTVVIPFKYEYAYGFNSGIARICSGGILSDYGTYTNGKYGFIRTDGTEILPADSYWAASDFQSELGYAYATNGNSDRVLIDRNGVVHKADENWYAPIDAEYIRVNTPQDENGISKNGIMDRYGNVVIPIEYAYPVEILGGNLFRTDDGIIYNSKFEAVHIPKENEKIFAPYSSKVFLGISVADSEVENHWFTGLMTYDGKIVIPPEYEVVRDMGEGLIYAQSSAENFLFDYSGRLLSKLNGQAVDVCSDGFFIMKDFDTMDYKIAVNPIERPTVYMDGEKVDFTDAFPFVINGRTLVPLRILVEKSGAEVTWDDETQTVTAKKGETEIKLTVNSNILTMGDGTALEIDVAPVLRDDRTYVPLRVFSEALGAEVGWDYDNYTATIKNH